MACPFTLFSGFGWNPANGNLSRQLCFSHYFYYSDRSAQKIREYLDSIFYLYLHELIGNGLSNFA